MPNETDYNRAKAIVELRISFFIHLTIYVLVNSLFVIINLSTDREVLWFKWPMIGWGIGLIIHGIVLFLAQEFSTLKEKMIEREINREKRSKDK
jgi:hypothetical protein